MACAAIDVYVKLPSGRTITVRPIASDTVQTISRQVAKDEGVMEKRVRLKYQGKRLKKQLTVGYLGICTETILKAEILSMKALDISFDIPFKSCVVPLVIDNITTVAEMQTMLKQKARLDEDNLIFKLGKSVLSNGGEIAADTGITDGATITVEVGGSVPEVTPEEESNVKENRDELADTDVQKVVDSFDAGGKNVEVVFSFDTTGSMMNYLREVRQKIKETTTRLLRDIPGIRIGVMAQGDYCDYSKYVVRVKDLTSDVDELVQFVNDVPETGGGDSPECYEWVLHQAQRLDWAEDSAKALVVIGDCEPHEVTYTDQHINWHDELDLLKAMGVKVYGVQVGMDRLVTPFYEELAERTGGAHLQFQHFSIITDMFLAVCYKEASPEQLQAYCEEVEQEGRMTDEAKEMFQELEKAPDAPPEEEEEKEEQGEEERPRRYVASKWWDPTMCNLQDQPLFKYDLQTDQWSLFTQNSPATYHPEGEASSSSRTKRSLLSRLSMRKKKGTRDSSTKSRPSKKCVVM